MLLYWTGSPRVGVRLDRLAETSQICYLLLGSASTQGVASRFVVPPGSEGLGVRTSLGRGVSRLAGRSRSGLTVPAEDIQQAGGSESPGSAQVDLRPHA